MTTTAPQPTTAPGMKLAAAVADRIVGDISARGWPVGEVLGSEGGLLERYGVSRAVLREAVRLLEHQQVARMQRGPGGGLVVTQPTLEAVIDPIAVYLFYMQTRVEHVAEARIVLEETVAGLAPERLTEDDIGRLRGLADRERIGAVDDHRELHALLGAITKNPALEVFVAMLNRLTQLYFPDVSRVGNPTGEAARRAHLAIIDSVIAGDVGLTRHRMRVHLEAEAEYLRVQLPTHQRLDASVLRSLGQGTKLGEQVARAIFIDVVEDGWPVGALLGSEADLMGRFDVSRAVLREAVRLLEHHQIARMRRGPGGGLFVARPGVEAAAGALALLLEQRGIRPGDLLELRIAIELAVVELAVKRMDDTDRSALEAALADEAAIPADDYALQGHDLHHVLGTMVDNPVFEFLALVMIRLARMHQADAPSSMRPLADAAVKAHAGIVQAVVAKDLELARHRMRRHLEALTAFWH